MGSAPHGEIHVSLGYGQDESAKSPLLSSHTESSFAMVVDPDTGLCHIEVLVTLGRGHCLG